MSSKSLVNTSNQSELLNIIKEYVENEIVYSPKRMEATLKQAKELYYEYNVSDSQKEELLGIIDRLEEIQNVFDTNLMHAVKDSKGKVDNYGIPTSFQLDKVPYTKSFKDDILKLVKTILNEQNEDLTEEEFLEINEAIIKDVIPLTMNAMGKEIGDSFQYRINKIKWLMMNSELPTTEYHFDTLEKASVHFANLHAYEHYDSRRDAWRDAVLRGVTTTKHHIQVDSWKQLERALERVKEWGKEEELGLIED